MIKTTLQLFANMGDGYLFKELPKGLKVDTFIRPVHLKNMNDAELDHLINRIDKSGKYGSLAYENEVRAYCHESADFYYTVLLNSLLLLTAAEKTVFLPVENWENVTAASRRTALGKTIIQDIIKAIKKLNDDIGFLGSHGDIELILGLDKDAIYDHTLNDYIDGKQ